MPRALRSLSALGAFVGGVTDEIDAAERRKLAEDERAFQKGQRARMVARQQKDDAYEADLANASKPVAVESGEVYQPQVDDEGNAMPANPTAGTFKAGAQRFPDRAAAEAAANDANTPEASNRRILTTMRSHGKVNDAAALESSVRQGKLADMQLSEAEAQRTIREYDRALINAVQTGGHQGLVQFIIDSKGDGAGGALKAKLVPTQDGKVQYALIDAQGQERVLPYQFTNDATGAQQAAFMLSKGVSPAEKLNHVRQMQNDEFERKDKDRNYSLREQEVRDKGLVRAAQAEAASARAEASRARMGAGGAGGPGGGEGNPAPVWDDKAAAFLRQRYTVTDPVSGQVGVDGAGLQFAKTVALAQARRNGGDLDTAIGYAFEIDNRIRQEAGNDPGKIDAKRRELMAKLLTPAAAPSPAPAPAAGGTRPAPARMEVAPAPAQAPQASPRAPAVPAPARGDQVLAVLEGQKQQRVAQAQAALDEASRMLAAAGKSGDPAAIQTYAARVNQANAALEAARR